MKNKHDILHLLEEVQTLAQTLCSEKADMGNQVKKIASDLSKLRAEKTQEIGNLQDINAQLLQELQETKTQLAQALQAPQSMAEPTKEVQMLQASHAQLTKELQETKSQLTQGLPSSQENIDSLPPEFQRLKDQLQKAEIQNQFLETELSKLYDEIQVLEILRSTDTSPASSSSPVE